MWARSACWPGFGGDTPWRSRWQACWSCWRCCLCWARLSALRAQASCPRRSISDFSAWPAWRSLWDWEWERPWPCGSFPMKISDKPAWVKAGRPRTTVSDHLTQGTVFLVICVVTGLLVELNCLWPTPNMQSYVPFGKLHLVAYTHLAMVGFILHTVFGVLSHLLPTTLAVERARSNKSRGPYLEELTGIVEQWRPVQVGALSLGTVGLVLVATLVWQFNLTSLPVHVATWASIGLLVLSLTLLPGKIGLHLPT